MSIIQKFLPNQIADDEIIIVMMPSCPIYKYEKKVGALDGDSAGTLAY